MRSLLLVAFVLLPGCNRLPTDPPPPARSGTVAVAPPGAVGAHVARENSPWAGGVDVGEGGGPAERVDGGPGATPAPGTSPGLGVDAGVAL
jgi:hypothetical protein